MMKKILWVALWAMTTLQTYAKEYELTSPNGKLKITVSDEGDLKWAVTHGSTTVLLPSAIAMNTNDGDYGRNVKVSKTTSGKNRQEFETPVYKKATVKDNYNWMTVHCSGGFDVRFRAYDDGAAYQFVTSKKNLTVYNETSTYQFAGDYKAFVPYVNDNRGGDRWCYSFESYYDEQKLSHIYKDSLAISPLAVCLPDGKKAVIMDAGVENYPGMYLMKGEGNSLQAMFPPCPLETETGGFNRLNIMPTRRAEYIAQRLVPQPLPWRVVIVSERDTDLLNNDMAQRLAPTCRLKDVNWIRPGRVAWDWWNNLNLTGVDFEAGMNTPTYEKYIDFAANWHFEYIIIDEGWSDPDSLLLQNDAIDLQHLIDYGRQKKVGIILWSSWRNMIKHMDEYMQYYADMGIKGFKVDFFDRDDQLAIQSAYEVAACAASHKLLLDLHGLKPFGLQRAYPNVLNFEGVKGLENSKWEPRNADGPIHDQPRYDATIPYLRMLAGPMDYTPGAMTNATRDNFFGNNNHPMSQGTRAHQMAMYVVFEAPLQMLADSPSKYFADRTCANFISLIPTVFDETVALDGELGEYVVLARRKGPNWYVAAMNNWTPRDITIDLSKLGADHSDTAFYICDGTNAHREATDYQKGYLRGLKPADTIKVHLAPGGGWAAVMIK